MGSWISLVIWLKKKIKNCRCLLVRAVVSWIKEEVWVFCNHECHHKKDTGVNACSGSSTVLVNCGTTSVSSWAPGVNYGEALESCEPQIRSVSALYRNYQTKEWHSYPTYLIQVGAQKEQQKELGFVSSEQQVVHEKEDTEGGPHVLKSLSPPLLSPHGLWLYGTWMQCLSMDFHKLSLFN